MMYLDMWRSVTFPEKQQVSECTTDCKRTVALDIRVLVVFIWIQKAALQLYRRNVSLLHTSSYVVPHDILHVSTASDKRGEKAWV